MTAELKEVASAQKAQPAPDEIDRTLGQVTTNLSTNDLLKKVIHCSEQAAISSIVADALRLLKNPAFKNTETIIAQLIYAGINTVLNSEKSLKTQKQLEATQKSNSASKDSFFLSSITPLPRAIAIAVEEVRNQDKNEKINSIMKQIIEGHLPIFITKNIVKMNVSKETIYNTIRHTLELLYVFDKKTFEVIFKTPNLVQEIIFSEVKNVLSQMYKEGDRSVCSTVITMPNGSLTTVPAPSHELFQNLQAAIELPFSDKEELSSSFQSSN